MRLRILAGIAFSVLTGCSDGFRDQFQKSDYRLPFEQRILQEAAAPIIVSGRILDARDVGPPQRSPGDGRIKTQLTQINLGIEEVIKGNIPTTSIEFYYFTYSRENPRDLGVPPYFPFVGQHRIFFLKPYNGAYRSVGDVTDFTFPVRTGTHPPGFCRGKTPGCCIAEILLTPREDMDAERFAPDLYQVEPAAEIFCSQDVARSLLEQLTKNPDQRISQVSSHLVRSYKDQATGADRRNRGQAR